MENSENKFSVQVAGTMFQLVNRSSPANLVLLFYLVFSIFCYLFKSNTLWINSSILFSICFLLLLLFKPDRLWSESHTLEMKRLDTNLLGDKNNPQVSLNDYNQLYRPLNKKLERKTKA